MTDRTGAGARRTPRRTLTATAVALSLGVAIAVIGSGTVAVADEGDGASGPVLSQGLSLLAAEAAGATGAAGVAGSGHIDPTLGLRVDSQGRVAVIVAFSSAEALDAAVPVVGGLGEIVRVTHSQPTIVMTAFASQFEALAAVDGVVSVTPVSRTVVAGGEVGAATSAVGVPAAPADAASCNPLPVEADAPGALNSAAARAAFGVDGTGVTVGIISNSYAAVEKPYRTAAQDVAAGALPGAANPCGYTTDVVVVEEGSALFGPVTDEGRAMAQLVHGVAPGARLMFATAGGTQATYADNILALEKLGADIIVDDAIIFTEPVYQEGIIGSAIRTVEAEGVLYLAAAQNQTSFGLPSTPSKVRYNEGEIISSWATSAYTPTGCPALVTSTAREIANDPTVAVDCQNFGTASSPTAFLQAELGVGTEYGEVIAQWGEPIYGVESSLVLISFSASSDGSDMTVLDQSASNQYPTFPFTQNIFVPENHLPSSATYNFALVRLLDSAAPGLPPVKIQFELDDTGVASLGNGTPWPADVTIGPSIQGHPADESVLTLGAASVLTPDTIEKYSGVGPVEYLFEPATATPSTPVRIASPVVRAKPDVVSVDMSLTTFFPDGATGEFRFGGTSAATPNAGAVAALALQHAPSSSPAELREALVGSGVDMGMQVGDYGVSAPYITGSGRIDAVAALTALTPSPSPTPSPTPSPVPGPAPAPSPGADAGSNRLADTGSQATAEGWGGLAGMALLAALTGAALLTTRTVRRGRIHH